MNRTKIEWTDFTWNPVTGCSRNCDYCYAAAMAHRFHRSFEPQFHPERLNQPLKRKKPAKIFVCSAGEMFGPWVPEDWIILTGDVTATADWHTFQLLTKFPDRMMEYTWPKNCWLGATATDQASADLAVSAFRRYRCQGQNTLFLSCEPLLGPVIPTGGVMDWLIIGACSWPRPQQPEEEWVTDLVEWADVLKIPVFTKDNLKVGPVRREWPRR